jgi:serine protease inhibitor
MNNSKHSRIRAIAGLVWAATLVLVVGSAGVGGTPARPANVARDACVLELVAPEAATVMIDGRDYGHKRRFTFSALKPGVKYRCRIEVRVADAHEEHTLEIEAGQAYRLSALERPPEEEQDDEPADDLSRAGRGVTAMGLDLYRRMAEKPGNLLVAPLGLESVLAMTAAGARTQTLEQMIQVLRLPANGDRDTALAALLAELQQPGAVDGTPTDGQLQVANALWVHRGDSLSSDFVSAVQTSYGAHVQAVDFARETSAVRQQVNDWIASCTHNRISELLEEGSPSADSRLLLTSALYFRGQWATPFDSKETAPATFHLPGSAEVSVPMMTQRARLRHYRGEKLQMLELPYADKRLAMLIMLPDESANLATIERSLSDATLRRYVRGLSAADVAVSIPRFQVDWSGSLKGAFSALGMSDAFAAAADFGGISQDQDLFITDLAHRAWIAVDEEGSEAAAAAAVTMAPKAVLGPRLDFKADRPFVFLIYDLATGTTVFAGRLADPRS